jgi:hypothetical protein
VLGTAIGAAAHQIYQNYRTGELPSNSLGQALLVGARDGMVLALGGEFTGRLLGRLGSASASAESQSTNWTLGSTKSAAKWGSQMEKRGWTSGQITEAIESGERFAAENLVNKGNAATRYVHPTTGRSVVVDNATSEVIHVGGDGFRY